MIFRRGWSQRRLVTGYYTSIGTVRAFTEEAKRKRRRRIPLPRNKNSERIARPEQ